jgi:hypothetical protein
VWTLEPQVHPEPDVYQLGRVGTMNGLC